MSWLAAGKDIFQRFSQVVITSVREASKKTGTSTRNQGGRAKPKHRCIKYQDGAYVQKGTLLLTQNKLRCHPGMNVGFGRNGTLWAMVPGRVMVTCEKYTVNPDHTWAARCYAGREGVINKKYFHVLPDPPHFRFKLKDAV